MSATDPPTSFRDPRYVATIVGVLATGTIFVYAALVDGPPTPETVGFVVLAVTLPTTLAYELARRYR